MLIKELKSSKKLYLSNMESQNKKKSLALLGWFAVVKAFSRPFLLLQSHRHPTAENKQDEEKHE